MQVDFNSSKTRENLMRAFAGECQARQRYYMAALTAQQQKLIGIERMLRFTAEQEERHAMVFFKLMGDAAGQNIDISAGFPADVYTDIQQLLDAAAQGEQNEFERIYPEFSRIAADEGFQEAAAKFSMISEIEECHRKRFSYYADLMRRDELFRSESTEESWICLNCGHIHKGSEPPRECPVCNAEQGYFIRHAEAAFTSPAVIMQA